MRFKLFLLCICLLTFSCNNSSPTVSDTPSTAPTPISSTDTVAEESPYEPLLKISEIAGKTPEEVSETLGTPTSTEIVHPSDTPCPCPKNTYQDGEIEVVFMNGKADWITVNLPTSEVDTSGSYLSVQDFDTYSYIKVTTD